MLQPIRLDMCVHRGPTQCKIPIIRAYGLPASTELQGDAVWQRISKLPLIPANMIFFGQVQRAYIFIDQYLLSLRQIFKSV